MSDDLVERIKADQKNGTPGPWEKRSFGSGTMRVIMREGINGKPDPTRDGSTYGYHAAYVTMYNIGGRHESDTDCEKSANASRIARVPDMESRILADAEALKAADALVGELQSAISCAGPSDYWVSAARQAIAAYRKARGGSE